MGLVGRKPEQQPERHSGRLVQFVLHGYEASDHNVYQLYYRTSQGTWNDGGGRAAGMSVRCMQDTENR